jgi:hypothetical protein
VAIPHDISGRGHHNTITQRCRCSAGTEHRADFVMSPSLPKKNYELIPASTRSICLVWQDGSVIGTPPFTFSPPAPIATCSGPDPFTGRVVSLHATLMTSGKKVPLIGMVFHRTLLFRIQTVIQTCRQTHPSARYVMRNCHKVRNTASQRPMTYRAEGCVCLHV